MRRVQTATSALTEAGVAQQVDAIAHALGWEVERYEQSRATRITEGLPDRRYVHRARGLRVWVELKRPRGKLTTAQYAWLTAELDADGLATVVEDVEQWASLCRLLGYGTSSVRLAEARDRCRAWVDLCWQRGPREGKRRGS